MAVDQGGRVLADRAQVRGNLRTLEHHDDIDVDDPEPGAADEAGGVPQQLDAVGPLPTGVRVGEVAPDVPQGGGTKDTWVIDDAILRRSSISRSTRKPISIAVKSLNCQNPTAFEVETASGMSALSCNTRYLKSSGTPSSLKIFSMMGK
mgnify:CR=1 FL=1